MKLRIKEFRTARNWTGQHLADLTGLSRPYISELESGKKIPSPLVLDQIANALGVTVGILIGEDQDERLADHLATLRTLSPEDQQAVLRHARGLARK